MATVKFQISVPVVTTPEGIEAAEQKLMNLLQRLAKDLAPLKGASISVGPFSYEKEPSQFTYPLAVHTPWYRSSAALSQLVENYGLDTKNPGEVIPHRFSCARKDLENILIGDFPTLCKREISYKSGQGIISNEIGAYEIPFSGKILDRDAITSWDIFVKRGKYGFYDKWGRETIPAIYDAVGSFTKSGLCPVKCGGKYGVIDMKDQPVVSFSFEHLEAVYADDERLGKHGLFVAKLDGKFGLIDKDGSVAIPFEYDYLGRNVPKGYRSENINELLDGYLVACKGHKIGIVDVNHEIVVPIERDINDLASMNYPEIRFGASADRKVNVRELEIGSLEKQYAFVSSMKPSNESLQELWHELNGMRRVTFENFDDPKVLKAWWEQDRQSELRKIKGNIEDISATVLEQDPKATKEDMVYPAEVHLLEVPPMDESILFSEQRDGLYISPPRKVYNIEKDITDATVNISIERYAMYPYGFSSEFEEQQVEMQITEMEKGLLELQKKQSEMELDIQKYKYSEPDRLDELKLALEFAILARQEISESRWVNSQYSHDPDSGPGDFEYYKQREYGRIDKEIDVLQQMIYNHCPNAKKLTPTKFLQQLENNIRQESAWVKLVREDNLIKQEHKL